MVGSGAFSQAIGVSQRRLSRMIAHVLKRWIPINTVVLSKIRARLAQDSYKDDRCALIRDLKSDPALYTWCLRSLCQRVQERPDKDPYYDPLRHLESIELEELSKILAVDERKMSGHSLASSDEYQLRILREALLGASAAEELSKSNSGETRAYGAALLRQLGLTLLTWNYPELMNEVMQRVKRGANIDSEVAKRLGFSPGLFATALVRSWGVSKRKCVSLGMQVTPDGTYQEIGGPSVTVLDDNFLRDVCQAGELLARANDPQHYPEAREDWAIVEDQVQTAIGRSGMARIRENFEEKYADYVECLPAFDGTAQPLADRRRYPDTEARQRLCQKNKFIGDASLVLQVALNQLYGRLSQANGSNRELVRMLVQEIFPQAGFRGACVFTMDPVLSRLIPQLRFGTLTLHEMHETNVKPLMNVGSDDVINAAFQRAELVVEAGSGNSRKVPVAIAGGLGKLRRVGVLYAEHAGYDMRNGTDLLERDFRALSMALNDCLNL